MSALPFVLNQTRLLLGEVRGPRRQVIDLGSPAGELHGFFRIGFPVAIIEHGELRRALVSAPRFRQVFFGAGELHSHRVTPQQGRDSSPQPSGSLPNCLKTTFGFGRGVGCKLLLLKE